MFRTGGPAMPPVFLVPLLLMAPGLHVGLRVAVAGAHPRRGLAPPRRGRGPARGEGLSRMLDLDTGKYAVYHLAGLSASPPWSSPAMIAGVAGHAAPLAARAEALPAVRAAGK